LTLALFHIDPSASSYQTPPERSNDCLISEDRLMNEKGLACMAKATKQRRETKN